MTDWTSLYYDSWRDLVRVLLLGIPAYVVLVLTLRISGKRTLTKLNAFDFVVTIALGSTLATILLNKDITLAEGVLALVLFVSLQYVISWSSVRFPCISTMIKSEPTLLVHRGVFLERSMRRQRVTRSEIQSVLCKEGLATLTETTAVVLETDGSFSVLNNPSSASEVSL